MKRLTERERSVLKANAQAVTIKVIAFDLHITRQTIYPVFSRCCAKLGIDRANKDYRLLLQRWWIENEEPNSSFNLRRSA